MLFDDLLFPGLDCKIALGKGNLFFAGIAVLGDQIACIAGEQDVLNLPL
jgi:hypothetical protein